MPLLPWYRVVAEKGLPTRDDIAQLSSQAVAPYDQALTWRVSGSCAPFPSLVRKSLPSGTLLCSFLFLCLEAEQAKTQWDADHRQKSPSASQSPRWSPVILTSMQSPPVEQD